MNHLFVNQHPFSTHFYLDRFMDSQSNGIMVHQVHQMAKSGTICTMQHNHIVETTFTPFYNSLLTIKLDFLNIVAGDSFPPHFAGDAGTLWFPW